MATELGAYLHDVDVRIAAAWNETDLPMEDRALGIQGRVTLVLRPLHRSGLLCAHLGVLGNLRLDEMARIAIPRRFRAFPKEWRLVIYPPCHAALQQSTDHDGGVIAPNVLHVTAVATRHAATRLGLLLVDHATSPYTSKEGLTHWGTRGVTLLSASLERTPRTAAAAIPVAFSFSSLFASFNRDAVAADALPWMIPEPHKSNEPCHSSLWHHQTPPEPPLPKEQELSGQLVELAPPEVEEILEESEYLADHNQRVPKETPDRPYNGQPRGTRQAVFEEVQASIRRPHGHECRKTIDGSQGWQRPI